MWRATSARPWTTAWQEDAAARIAARRKIFDDRLAIAKSLSDGKLAKFKAETDGEIAEIMAEIEATDASAAEARKEADDKREVGPLTSVRFTADASTLSCLFLKPFKSFHRSSHPMEPARVYR
jgi:hypothetical protein